MLFYILLIIYILIVISLYALAIYHRGISSGSWSDWAFEVLMIIFFPIVIVLFAFWFLINFVDAIFNIAADFIRALVDRYFPKKKDK